MGEEIYSNDKKWHKKFILLCRFFKMKKKQQYMNTTKFKRKEKSVSYLNVLEKSDNIWTIRNIYNWKSFSIFFFVFYKYKTKCSIGLAEGW
jgi:hypothetical protein